MGVNFEKLLVDLVTPLVIHTEDVSVTLLSEDEEVINMQILVHQEDLGRVIGKSLSATGTQPHFSQFTIGIGSPQ